jgi:hypothetical protein
MGEIIFVFCFATSHGPLFHENKLKANKHLLHNHSFITDFITGKCAFRAFLHRHRCQIYEYLFASITTHCGGLISASNAPILTIFLLIIDPHALIYTADCVVTLLFCWQKRETEGGGDYGR